MNKNCWKAAFSVRFGLSLRLLSTATELPTKNKHLTTAYEPEE